MPFNSVTEDSSGEADKECAGFSVFNCMLAILRVLLNLTHENSKFTIYNLLGDINLLIYLSISVVKCQKDLFEHIKIL